MRDVLATDDAGGRDRARLRLRSALDRLDTDIAEDEGTDRRPADGRSES